MSPLDARLFPDYAAVPTAAERRGARTYWRTAQTGLDLFATPAPAVACPACGGEHEQPCPHGEALSLNL